MATEPPSIAPSTLEWSLVSALSLIERYDMLLLDAYGVLVHSSAALPGAAEFLRLISRANKEFLVVTNDASRLPTTAARRFASFGLDVRADQIVTSGSLLAPYFQMTGLADARCMVLGPDDSFEYVRRAGGKAIAPSATEPFDAVVLCDDAGYPFLESIDMLLTNLCRHYDRGATPRLVLPNPDVIYPKGESTFGVTSGGAALLLEAALAQRYPQIKPTFARLGKPFGPMFREVRRIAGSKAMVMIGDQIETDIVGARTAGIDAALVETGISRWENTAVEPGKGPNYRLTSLVGS